MQVCSSAIATTTLELSPHLGAHPVPPPNAAETETQLLSLPKSWEPLPALPWGELAMQPPIVTCSLGFLLPNTTGDMDLPCLSQLAAKTEKPNLWHEAEEP